MAQEGYTEIEGPNHNAAQLHHRITYSPGRTKALGAQDRGFGIWGPNPVANALTAPLLAGRLSQGRDSTVCNARL